MRIPKTPLPLVVLLAWPMFGGALHAQTKVPVQPEQVRKQLRRATKPARQPAAAAARKAPAQPRPSETRVARRDPFQPLIGQSRPGATLAHPPPGKAGLVVSTLRVDGTVKAPSGMIAVVSNPQQSVYFLREGDKLYDGTVERITMEAVLFREVGADAFGKPVEREVTKRLYPSSGEQQ